MNKPAPEPFHQPQQTTSRRRFLVRATSTVAGVGVAGAAVPFVGSFLPSERAKAGGAPVEVDISKLAVGQQMTVLWRSRPIWVIHRSKKELATLPKMVGRVADPYSKVPQQPPDMSAALHLKEGVRAIKPEYLVLVGICTHLGCIPDYKPVPGSEGANWLGGFLCPCHGSRYDLSGRVLKDFPAPRNLPVPPYYYEKDTLIKIGTTKKGGDLAWQPETW
jgi:ubiquinol-cytochrome c reductase iron-sulfur subunit